MLVNFLLRFLLFIVILTIPIRTGQYTGILFQFGIYIGNMPINFLWIEIILLGVLCPQFGTVSRYKLATNQVKMFCQLNCSPKYLLNRLWIILSKIGNGVMVGNQPAHQPHDFQVALA